MNAPLTTQEENLIKDILKLIGNDDDLNTGFPKSLEYPMEQDEFDKLSDSIFNKLGNGRVTFGDGEPKKFIRQVDRMTVQAEFKRYLVLGAGFFGMGADIPTAVANAKKQSSRDIYQFRKEKLLLFWGTNDITFDGMNVTAKNFVSLGELQTGVI